MEKSGFYAKKKVIKLFIEETHASQMWQQCYGASR